MNFKTPPMFPPGRGAGPAGPPPRGPDATKTLTSKAVVPSMPKSLDSLETSFFAAIKLPKTTTTWRVIPFSKWLVTMASKSPTWGYGTPSKWPFHGL